MAQYLNYFDNVDEDIIIGWPYSFEPKYRLWMKYTDIYIDRFLANQESPPFIYSFSLTLKRSGVKRRPQCFSECCIMIRILVNNTSLNRISNVKKAGQMYV